MFELSAFGCYIYIALPKKLELHDQKSLLEQSKGLRVTHEGSNYIIMLLLLGVEMWELLKIVIPKIQAKWKTLAYCMKYTPQEVETFEKESNSVTESCNKMFVNWLTTYHGPRPKTYQTLLKYVKEVDELAAASEVIERELIEGR